MFVLNFHSLPFAYILMKLCLAQGPINCPGLRLNHQLMDWQTQPLVLQLPKTRDQKLLQKIHFCQFVVSRNLKNL